jgi:hypothetical protein
MPLTRPDLRPLATVLLAALAGCGGDDPMNDETRYFAAVYGTVRQADAPVSGIEVRAEVFTGACPVAGQATSNQSTRSGGAGRYRVLITSALPSAGQCLRATAAGGTPVVTALTDMPFSATSGTEIQDSVEVDLTIP